MSTVDTSTAEELNQGGSDFILTSLEVILTLHLRTAFVS